MPSKILLSLVAALVFLASSVLGMGGDETPKKTSLHESATPGEESFFTPQQGSVEENTARNRALAERTNEDDDSSLEKRGDFGATSEDGSKDTSEQSGPNVPAVERNLFQTPPTKKTVIISQSEPPLKKQKEVQNKAILSRERAAQQLNINQIERLAWLRNTQEIADFSQGQRELVHWIAEKKNEAAEMIKARLENPQEIKKMRSDFISTLEQCYGEEFVDELFSEGEKEQFLEQKELLSLQEATDLIQRADDLMQHGKSYLLKSEENAKVFQDAIDAFNMAQEQAQQAQQNYDALNGSPFQHLVATLWYGTKTLVGTVSASCVFALAVTFHHGIPVVLGVSSIFVGYIVDPANLHRFVGCLYIPDNFTNMQTSWGKMWKARDAAHSLEKKQKELQTEHEKAEAALSDFETRKRECSQGITPSFQKELDEGAQAALLLKLKKKIDAFRANEQQLLSGE